MTLGMCQWPGMTCVRMGSYGLKKTPVKHVYIGGNVGLIKN